jgi:hypothetical protein
MPALKYFTPLNQTGQQYPDIMHAVEKYIQRFRLRVVLALPVRTRLYRKNLIYPPAYLSICTAEWELVFVH